MHWIAPPEKDTDDTAPEKRLSDAAGQAVAAGQFPVTDFNSARPEGLLFQRFAKVRFAAKRAKLDYDAFGRIYEYFLGEFYTPSCIVRLLTEVIGPYHGRILDLRAIIFWASRTSSK